MVYERDDFVTIDPTIFIMGPPEHCSSFKKCESRRKIQITNQYHLCREPVSVKRYLEFINETHYDIDYNLEYFNGKEWVLGDRFIDINSEFDNPVVGVSYFDALEFISWASRKDSLPYRLPTEAEFELASRQNCDCKEECAKSTILKSSMLIRNEEAPYKSGPYSIYDSLENNGVFGMNGLVWQWCSDWFFYYSEEDVINPTGPKVKPNFAPWKGEQWKPGRVIRGGSFNYSHSHSSCYNRHFSKEEDRNINLGFRLCF